MNRPLHAALPPWVVARVVVACSLLTASAIEAATVRTRPRVGTVKRGGLLSWDASWYLDIARDGYDVLPTEGLRFFPLYPLIARLASPGNSTAVVLVLVTNVAALAYAVHLFRLVHEDLGDEALAERTAWLVALAPVAFVLVMGYTEALAGLLAVMAFAAARRQRWGAAAAAGLLAGAMRPSGLLLVVPLAIEAARWIKKADGRERAARVVAVSSPILGTLPYVTWVHVTRGDGLLPFSVQYEDHLRGSFANPIATVTNALSHLGGSDIVLGLRGLWAFGLVAIAVVAVRRLPASYSAYAVVSVALALANTSLGSLERYAYGSFPMVISAATLCRGRVGRIVIPACAGALACYSLLAFLDLYVP